MVSTFIFVFLISPTAGLDLGLVLGGPGGVQDGLGIVLVRTLFRLAARDRFLHRLGPLLRSFWGPSGFIFDHLGVSWARFGSSWALLGSFLDTLATILGSYNLNFASTHRCIIPSTYGSSTLHIPARRTARSD